MRRGQRKVLYRGESHFLEGPHEIEVQRKVLRRGKNLAFSKDTCLEKEKVLSKVTPRKVGSWVEMEAGAKRWLGWRLAR